MSKRAFIICLTLSLFIFSLLSQCKVKSGVKRITVDEKVEYSEPNSDLTPPPPPQPRQELRQRPESRPEIEAMPEKYAEKEVIKNSEVINSEQNNLPPSDSNPIMVGSPGSVNETNTTKVINEKNAGVKATLGISYFKSIRQNETKDLRVSAIFDGDAALVRKKIRDIEAVEYEFVPKEDTSIIRVIKDITLFKRLKITLHYDKSDFTITPIPDDAKDEQELDFTTGNNWHWTVRAVSDKPHPAIVKVEIFGENHKGDLKLIALKEVEIKIDITQSDSFWSKVGQWPGDNIDYIIEGMLVPLIIYLWKRRRKKK